MPLAAIIIGTIIFGFMAIVSFIFVFKPYQDDDETYLDIFSYDTGVLSTPTFILELILKGLKKIFPHFLYVIIFRFINLLLGVLMIFIVYLFWTL